MTVPVTVTGFVTPLIVISPLAVVTLRVEADVLRPEAELRELLGVEEVRAQKVGGQVRVLHVDAGDAGCSCEGRAPVLVHRERRGHLVEPLP